MTLPSTDDEPPLSFVPTPPSFAGGGERLPASAPASSGADPTSEMPHAVSAVTETTERAASERGRASTPLHRNISHVRTRAEKSTDLAARGILRPFSGEHVLVFE